jgi:hypothetical protein
VSRRAATRRIDVQAPCLAGRPLARGRHHHLAPVPRATWGRAPPRTRTRQHPGRTPHRAVSRRRAQRLACRVLPLNSSSFASRRSPHSSPCTNKLMKRLPVLPTRTRPPLPAIATAAVNKHLRTIPQTAKLLNTFPRA